MSTLPETVLQFGSGRFLRAFADLFIHHANEAGQNVGRVVIIQSTGDDRATLLNQRGGRYVVALRGVESLVGAGPKNEKTVPPSVERQVAHRPPHTPEPPP